MIMERSREDVSFSMSGVDGRGVVHSNVPMPDGVVSLAVDVSDGEALVWFDRERRLRRLGDAEYGPGWNYLVLLAEVGGKKLSMLAHTVKLLPIGYFKDIDSYCELSEYVDVSLPEALRDIFLDVFAAGDGKPKCLPSREELNADLRYWGDDYGKLCGEVMEASADMLFDIEKSLGYVRWLRERLVVFYRDELGFDI